MSFSVSELNRHVKLLLDSDLLLKDVIVSGEISNYKYHSSGHHYFSLKDENSSIKCVMFKGNYYQQGRNTIIFENGKKVTAYGKVSVYERDGAYQFYCTKVEENGKGDLHLAFEQLKKKLQEEGLFDKTKKNIPSFPKKIALITSPTGAAVRDIIRIIGNRWPLTELVVVPVRVQGIEAPSEIAEAIRFVNCNRVADLIITGRGGGSIEDLWAFNEEVVARAIFSSEIPIISAVGHEPDITIADYVADRRAATPSNAAEIAVPDIKKVKEELIRYSERFNPITYISNKRIEFDRFQDRLNNLIYRKLDSKKQQLIVLAASLDAMSPLKVLARGYSVATINNKTIKSTSDVAKGDSIVLRVSDGNISCKVE